MGGKGMALLVALGTLVLVSGLGTLLFTRTLGEVRHSGLDARIVQTLMLARAGALVGGGFLAGPFREALDSLVGRRVNPSSCWAFGGGDCQGREPDPIGVAQALKALARELQGTADGICGQDFGPGEGLGVRVRVHFTSEACRQALPRGVELPPGRFVEGAPGSAQTYALPFVLVAEGQVGPFRRNVVLQGEYRFTVGRSSFARYLLFTHIHALPTGTAVWFTDGTLFDGPVHTNTHFYFYRRPWFGGMVTSAGCTSLSSDGQTCGSQSPGAYFYGAGFLGPNQMRPNPSTPVVSNRYGTHAPSFAGGVDWGAGFIPLPQNAHDQRRAAQEGGLYFGGSLRTLRLFLGCEDAQGNPVACNAPGATKYQYLEAEVCRSTNCTQVETKVYRYYPNPQTGQNELYERQRDGTFSRRGNFNGVIYVEGAVGNLTGPGRTGERPNPALAEFAQITVAAGGTVRIGGDLTYEVPPCTAPPRRNPDGTVSPAECPNLSARNVLGVYSQGGNVLISQNAPSNIQIHATLMSGGGVVGVERYDIIPPKGTAFLLGGVIQKYYGAFGTFDASTGAQRSGYGRTFVYDPRFLRGFSPPYFPTTGVPRVLSVGLLAFGQKEQAF